jgi:hypothetical protein
MRIHVEADEGRLVDYSSVAGYALVSIVRTEDGGLDVNRDFHVQAIDEQESQVVSDFLKKADESLSVLFPQEKEPEPKIWVPA